jgi:hypothetical protein
LTEQARFYLIRLELEGSPDRGYAFTAPLTADGSIDASTFRKQPERCTALRFWRGEDDRHGRLVLTRSRRWTFAFAFDNDPQDDDSGWRQDAYRFLAEARVTLTGEDGLARTYRVAGICPPDG